MTLIYTSATTRNRISVSLSFRLQKKAENYLKKKYGRNVGKKIIVVSIAHVAACKGSVRKQCVNTTGLLCGSPPKPLP